MVEKLINDNQLDEDCLSLFISYKKVIMLYNGSMLQTSEDSLYGLSDSR